MCGLVDSAILPCMYALVSCELRSKLKLVLLVLFVSRIIASNRKRGNNFKKITSFFINAYNIKRINWGERWRVQPMSNISYNCRSVPETICLVSDKKKNPTTELQIQVSYHGYKRIYSYRKKVVCRVSLCYFQVFNWIF